MNIVAITSCATGIAHSYMAAEALKLAAGELGDQIKIEVQGAMGIENELSQSDIDQADLVIWAVDVGVSKAERFEKKNVFEIGPHEVITNAVAAINEAKNES